MSVVLINPNLVVQKNDPFTTGVVYMPIGLAYLASALIENEISTSVIDAFAERPDCIRSEGKFWIYGLTDAEVVDRIPATAHVVLVYAINLTNHMSTVGIVSAIRRLRSELSVVVVENTQAVTAYALCHVAETFYEAGADYVLTGESEYQGVRLVRALLEGCSESQFDRLEGLGARGFYNKPSDPISHLDIVPFPAWDLFPLENYWRLRFAHGPQTGDRYLPILTSRGCPYPCSFCVVPATNRQKWRFRSPENVVDEIEHSISKYGVREFHIEDLDPTISDPRIRAICLEILSRELNIVWKIVAGTKVETIQNEETLDLMAESGCRYISISPETGSPRMLRLMRKPFKRDHAVRLVKHMHQIGIRSQACFVLGYPGETDSDRGLTWNLVRELTRQGVDEIALFMITPVPGSAVYETFQRIDSLSELNFSPTWRTDYDRLNRFRLHLYVSFLLWKIWYYPFKTTVQVFHFLKRRFETKMEMVPYRALWLFWHAKMADGQFK